MGHDHYSPNRQRSSKLLSVDGRRLKSDFHFNTHDLPLNSPGLPLIVSLFSTLLQNLDSWKSSRRKRVEHIIERVVEVKKLEIEEHDRTRKKSKTFSEMMEER